MKPERVVGLDVMRVIAIFLVLVTHATESFYISMMGELIVTEANIPWVSILVSIAHACVPLFVVISGFLLLPIKESSEQFYKKRLPRIFVPFVIWSLLYLTLPFLWEGMNIDFAKSQLLRLTYNFSWASGHLWFIYMFIGVYLFIPILSPWLKEVSVKLKLVFLGVWALSTCHHFFLLLIPETEVFGETFFSEFSALYYFSGYLGFAVLGHVIKVHWSLPARVTIAIGCVCFTVGFVVSYAVMFHQLTHAKDLSELTLSLRNCTLNVALMAVGIFLLAKDVRLRSVRLTKGITSLAAASFGIYLLHMLILPHISNLVIGKLHILTAVLVISLCTLILSYGVVQLLRKLKIGEWLVPG